MNEIAEKLRQIVADNLKMAAQDISMDMSIGDVPQWGSMAQMSIITTIQSEFNLKIPMEDLFDLTSVQDLVDEVIKLKD